MATFLWKWYWISLSIDLFTACHKVVHNGGYPSFKGLLFDNKTNYLAQILRSLSYTVYSIILLKFNTFGLFIPILVTSAIIGQTACCYNVTTSETGLFLSQYQYTATLFEIGYPYKTGVMSVFGTGSVKIYLCFQNKWGDPYHFDRIWYCVWITYLFSWSHPQTLKIDSWLNLGYLSFDGLSEFSP